MEEQKQQNPLEIDLNHEIAQGTYANLAIIAHSTSEFIIDFVRLDTSISVIPIHRRYCLF